VATQTRRVRRFREKMRAGHGLGEVMVDDVDGGWK
jgi:hypothetical protein